MEVAAVSMPDRRDHAGPRAGPFEHADPFERTDPFEQTDPFAAPAVARRATAHGAGWAPVLATALGGVVGAEARYGVAVAMPHPSSAFAWSTVVINVTGCLAIGALMVVLLELTSPHRLARPFLGVGVLGGYTTYSTFAVDVQRLVVDHRPAPALAYLAITVLSCAAAVWLATVTTLGVGRWVVANRVRRRQQMGSRP